MCVPFILSSFNPAGELSPRFRAPPYALSGRFCAHQGIRHSVRSARRASFAFPYRFSGLHCRTSCALRFAMVTDVFCHMCFLCLTEAKFAALSLTLNPFALTCTVNVLEFNFHFTLSIRKCSCNRYRIDI